ncbi:MAG: hypothetical protein JW867_04680 [Candidatus Omnitrophica bacterium]|nr:hypothetical protein [Candidatus Omnitrophota bacterium]
MSYRIVRIVFSFLVIAFFAFPLMAKPPKPLNLRHADKNKDGVVTKKEIHMEKKWEKHQHSKVNSKLEAKYDSDGNGWLGPAEAKEMLKDRYSLIQTEGKAKVDSPIEAEYDINHDGIIDKEEAEDLKEELE